MNNDKFSIKNNFHLNNYNKAFISDKSKQLAKYRNFKTNVLNSETVSKYYNKLKNFDFKNSQLFNSVSETQGEKYFKVTKVDKRHSLIGLFAFLVFYLGILTFINKRKREKERRSVEEALKKYERDKLHYIETGHTRPNK